MTRAFRAAAFVVLSACWRGAVPAPAGPAEPVRAAPTPTPSPWSGACAGGSWGDVQIEELTIDDRGDTIVVRGILAFVGRRTRATLRGRPGAPLIGSMTEIEGLGTKWKIELDLDAGDPDHAAGRFVELTGSGHRTDMCSFDLRR